MRIAQGPLIPEEVGAAISAAGDAVSSGVDTVKGIKSKFQPAADESQDDSSSEFQRRQLFNSLANTFKQMGSTNPQYTDPEQLFNLIGQSNLVASQSYTQILEKIKDLLRVCMPLTQSDPQLVDDVLNFTFEKFTKSGFNAQATMDALDNLQEKASDPNKDAIVIAILKKNFALAQILTLMSSFGKMDSQTYVEMGNIQALATQMLGRQSAELLRAENLMSEKAKTNFAKLTQSKATFDFMLPIATLKEHMIQAERGFLTNFVQSDFAHQIASDPFVSGLLAFAGGAKQMASALGSGAIGETMGATGGIK